MKRSQNTLHIPVIQIAFALALAHIAHAGSMTVETFYPSLYGSHQKLQHVPRNLTIETSCDSAAYQSLMSIKAEGNIGINNEYPQYTLYVNGDQRQKIISPIRHHQRFNKSAPIPTKAH